MQSSFSNLPMASLVAKYRLHCDIKDSKQKLTKVKYLRDLHPLFLPYLSLSQQLRFPLAAF